MKVILQRLQSVYYIISIAEITRVFPFVLTLCSENIMQIITIINNVGYNQSNTTLYYFLWIFFFLYVSTCIYNSKKEV